MNCSRSGYLTVGERREVTHYTSTKPNLTGKSEGRYSIMLLLVGSWGDGELRVSVAYTCRLVFTSFWNVGPFAPKKKGRKGKVV